jgi:hypothetical protein
MRNPLKQNLSVLILAIVIGLFAGGISIAMASLNFSGTTIAGDGSVVMDASSTISIGTSTATGITIGRTGEAVTLPGTVVNPNVIGSLWYGTSTGSVVPLALGANLSITSSTLNAAATSTLNATGTPSYIANLDTVLYIPANFASGCPWKSSDTDFGACVDDAYNSVSSTASSVVIIAPRVNATFATGINFGNTGEMATLEGQGNGTQLTYTGTGAAITVNDINANAVGPNYHNIALEDFTLTGTSNGTTSPTTGILVGGTNGGAFQTIDDVTVRYFGIDLNTATNTWNFTLENSTLEIGGYDIYINPPDNSGEAMNFLDDSIVDGGNSSAANCFYVGQLGVTTMNIQGGSMDDCQLYIGAYSVNVTESGVNHENPGYSIYGKYDDVVMASGTAFSSFGSSYFDDSTSSVSSPNEFITDNGYLTLSGDIISSRNGAPPVANVVNLLNDAQTISATGVANVGGNSFTSLISASASQNSPNVAAVFDNGNVGIGTATPSAKLDVNGNIALPYGSALMVDNAYPNPNILNTSYNSYDTLSLYTPGNVATDAIAKMTLWGNGDIGIGTTTPATDLQVTDANGSSTIRIGQASQRSCLEMTAASGTIGTLIYIFYDSNAVQYATTTKPSFCE